MSMSSRMKESLRSVDPLVFGASALIIGGFAAWGIIAPENLSSVIGGVLTWVLATFGWFYVFVAFVVLALSIFLMVHPWGRIRLGPDDSRPDFRTFTWIAMMFSAGLGSALMFYGVVEPLTHWAAPPHQLAEPRTQEAANIALQYTYFHWGFNGWAMYAVVGGSLAFFCYRKGMPMLLSSAFTPPLGPNAARKPMGRLIDVLGIVSTVFGMATSLGLNGLQLSGGLNYLLGTPNNNLVAVIIVASVTAVVPDLGDDRGREGRGQARRHRCHRDDRAVLLLVVRRWRHREGDIGVPRDDRQLPHRGHSDVVDHRRR